MTKREATGESRQKAFNILTKHPDLLMDDEPLDELLEEIALALDDARRLNGEL